MLKDRPEYDFENRVPSEYSNELHLYKARLYKQIRYGDDRFQVRILPYMIDVPDSEVDLLPKYPAFFKGSFPNGKSEKEACKHKRKYWKMDGRVQNISSMWSVWN